MAVRRNSGELERTTGLRLCVRRIRAERAVITCVSAPTLRVRVAANARDLITDAHRSGRASVRAIAAMIRDLHRLPNNR